MSQPDRTKSQAAPSYYDVNYGNFQTELYSDIRREAFGEDIGQNSWLSVPEQDMFLGWLELSGCSVIMFHVCLVKSSYAYKMNDLAEGRVRLLR